MDASGNVYVVDEQNDRVQESTSGGAYLRQWGTKGTGDGQFTQPEPIAIAPDGNIFVGDVTRIEVFDPSGNYLAQWGSDGSNPGQSEGVSGLAFDAQGNAYVTETNGARLQVFAPVVYRFSVFLPRI